MNWDTYRTIVEECDDENKGMFLKVECNDENSVSPFILRDCRHSAAKRAITEKKRRGGGDKG